MFNRFPLLHRLRYPLFALAVTGSLLGLHRGYSADLSSIPLEKQTKTVTITGMGFLPDQLTCREGDSVALVVVNADKRPHNFTIRELNVRTATLQPGESASVEFVARRSGTFAYLSDEPGHPEIGYQGRLKVE